MTAEELMSYEDADEAAAVFSNKDPSLQGYAVCTVTKDYVEKYPHCIM